VGGGIRTLEDIQQILRAGADKVSINTSAVNDPDLITRAAAKFGTQCIVVAVDVRRTSSPVPGGTPVALQAGVTLRLRGGHVRRYEAHRPGCHKVGPEAEQRGAGEILLTSMETDGTRNGFDIPVTRAISENVGIPWWPAAEWGPWNTSTTGFALGKADACLAASVFHYGEFTVRQVKEYLAGRGIPVRR